MPAFRHPFEPADPLLEVTREVVVAGGGSRRHRSRAGVAVLADGSLFAAWRVGRDMFQEPHGALVAARSADGGQTWEEPAPLLAEPGRDWPEDGGRSWSPLTATGFHDGDCEIRAVLLREEE